MKDTFKLELDRDWFSPGNVLNEKYLIISKPIPEFKNFWHKLGYYLTFKKYFKPINWSYKIETNDNRSY